MTRRRARSRGITETALALAWTFVIGCGESTPARPPEPVESVEGPPNPPVIPVAPEPDEVAAEAPPPTASSGDIYWIRADGARAEDGTPSVLVAIDAMPQPEGEVVGRFEVHNAHRDVRVIDEVEGPATVIIVGRSGACEARVTRARRVHTLWFSAFAGERNTARDPQTHLALDFEGCEGGAAGVVGVPLADVHVWTLRREDLTTRATPILVEGVRHVDDGMYGEGALPADAFRMIDVPAHGITVVVGNAPWVLRDGVVLAAGADANPIILIEAGPLLFVELQSASDEWLGSITDFVPRHAPRECDVLDSGSPMNVRAGPRGNATVVTSVAAGTHLTANATSGAWFHVASSPPGWAHESGLRCDPLEHPGFWD